jgi:hypothetical protein
MSSQAIGTEVVVLLGAFRSKSLPAFVDKSVLADYWVRLRTLIRHATFFIRDCQLTLQEACASSVLLFLAQYHASVWSSLDSAGICYALGANTQQSLRTISSTWSSALQQTSKTQTFEARSDAVPDSVGYVPLSPNVKD